MKKPTVLPELSRSENLPLSRLALLAAIAAAAILFLLQEASN